MGVQKEVGADGKVEDFKAHLVAQDFTQEYSDDSSKTIFPVLRLESLCTMLPLAMQLYQVDVTTTFLNGTLEEERRTHNMSTKEEPSTDLSNLLDTGIWH